MMKKKPLTYVLKALTEEAFEKEDNIENVSFLELAKSRGLLRDKAFIQSYRAGQGDVDAR